jgi:hypothetical protein
MLMKRNGKNCRCILPLNGKCYAVKTLQWTIELQCIFLLTFAAIVVTAIPNVIPDKLFGINLKKKQYTPLLFFTVPKGLSPECDAMEKIVSGVEKELKVKVERMDVLRQPCNEVLLQLITTKSPPFLYHRESCQSYSISNQYPAAQSGTAASAKRGSNGLPIYIDRDKVRAWAKGRYLKSLPRTVLTRIGTTAANTINRNELIEDVSSVQQQQQPTLLDQQQHDMLEDMALTPEQREGKKLIKERTETLREDAIRKREIQQEQDKQTSRAALSEK